jgi:hypothetical protein
MSIDDDKTSAASHSKWSISIIEKDPSMISRVPSTIGLVNPNNHSFMEKSHLSENYFSLAKR